MATYTVFAFLNFTSLWPTHPPLQACRRFNSRTKALAWARLAAPQIPFAEPDVLMAGGLPGEPAQAVMVYTDRLHPLATRMLDLPSGPPPGTCEVHSEQAAEAWVEASGSPLALRICDSCLRDAATLESFSRRVLQSAPSATQRHLATVRTRH